MSGVVSLRQYVLFYMHTSHISFNSSTATQVIQKQNQYTYPKRQYYDENTLNGIVHVKQCTALFKVCLFYVLCTYNMSQTLITYPGFRFRFSQSKVKRCRIKPIYLRRFYSAFLCLVDVSTAIIIYKFNKRSIYFALLRSNLLLSTLRADLACVTTVSFYITLKKTLSKVRE